MCVYSMIVDHYNNEWGRKRPQFPFPQPPLAFPTNPPPNPPKPLITEEELKRFMELLRRAKEYDEKNNQKDCEMESKKETLRKLAEQLGVKIEFP